MSLKPLLEQILRKQKGLEELAIHGVTEVQCTKPGDNYMSIVNLVEIKGSLPDGQTYESSVFVKRQPEGEDRRQMFLTDDAFHNETVMYEKILPMYDVSVACPRSLYATKDVIILENLRLAGYRMVDRRSGFNLAQSEQILTALAQFHGTSFHSLKAKSEQFTSAVSQLKVTGFMITAHQDMLEASMRRVIRDLQGQEMEETVLVLKGLQGRFAERLKSLRDPKDFRVLVHGDFWVNNILIREGKDPVRIVDLQNCAILSPAVDVWSFLYTSVDPSIVESAVPQLLWTYCTNFQKVLFLLKFPKEQIPSEETLMEELISRELYGFLVALMYIPALTVSEDNIPDLDALQKDVFLDDCFMDRFTGPDIKNRLYHVARFAVKRGLLNTTFSE